MWQSIMGVECRDPVVARPGAEIARQAPFGVIHQMSGAGQAVSAAARAISARDVGRDRP
jgi:hypothetical protein